LSSDPDPVRNKKGVSVPNIVFRQNLDLQRDALNRAGCSRIYEDRLGGAKAARPGLALALEVARGGDQLVVAA
jgi:DNA invertase Pin-like site-specific DNA recombinase